MMFEPLDIFTETNEYWRKMSPNDHKLIRTGYIIKSIHRHRAKRKPTQYNNSIGVMTHAVKGKTYKPNGTRECARRRGEL